MLRRVFDPWRHASTWWSLTHLVTDVLVGAVTFSFVVAVLAATFGLVITFFLAIPLFWLLMVGSRGLAHMERSRASALLGLDLLDPVAPLQSPSWWRRLLERARSAARWKEVGYLLLLLPLGALNLVLVVAAWCGSLALLALPLYVSALPEGTAKFWLFDVASGGDAWLVALAGLAGVVLIAPWVTVVLGRLDRVTCAWFLGPDERALQEARVRAAETGRAAAVGSAEAERRRIERDLHDGAQQRLVSLAMELGATREHFDDEDKDAIRARVVHAHEEAKAALQEIRDLVRGIHPVILEDRGLDAALSAVVARAPIPVSLEVDVAPRPTPEVESAAYFVVSEALTNVARHSGATNAAVSLVRAGDTLVIEVRDNGHGCDRPARCQRERRHRSRRPARAGDVARRLHPPGQPGRRSHDPAGGAAVRVMIAEDSVLLREGITRLLVDAGEEVVAGFGDADALLEALVSAPREGLPDLVVLDVRMPPTHTDEGVRAALQIRVRWPSIGILVLSQYVEERYATELISGDAIDTGDGVGGVGYLLKDRVADVRDFVDALRRVGDGGTVLDPEVVTQLLARARQQDPLERLTPRERTVLSLMAEGRSNAAIAQALVVSDGAVEKHVSNIFTKLDLPPASEDHRRVLAVLRWLES